MLAQNDTLQSAADGLSSQMLETRLAYTGKSALTRYQSKNMIIAHDT